MEEDGYVCATAAAVVVDAIMGAGTEGSEVEEGAETASKSHSNALHFKPTISFFNLHSILVFKVVKEDSEGTIGWERLEK